MRTYNIDVLDARVGHDVNRCDTDVSLPHKFWFPR